MATSQQTVTQEGDTRPSSHLWFTAEIQHMMYGFGDCSKPLAESAALIEDIVYKQMMQLIYQVEEVAHKRSARFIGIEDFLFLLRKDKMKLRRLLRYLDFKDLKAAAVKAIGLEEDDANAEDSKQTHLKKRRKICQDFLGTIDQTGELITLMDENEEDEIKKQRNSRAEILTRNMNPQQYLEFCEARQASFTPRYKMQKFKDWILSGVNLEIKPNAFALEILSYLAYETVAEIVDLALIVRRDKNVSVSDPFSHEMAPVCMNYDPNTTASKSIDQQQQLMSPSAGISSSSSTVAPPSTTTAIVSPQTPKATSAGVTGSLFTPFASPASTTLVNKARKKKIISQQSKDLITSQAITTSDIYEALRRFNQPIGPFADFSKLPLMPVRQRLFCC